MKCRPLQPENAESIIMEVRIVLDLLHCNSVVHYDSNIRLDGYDYMHTNNSSCYAMAVIKIITK